MYIYVCEDSLEGVFTAIYNIYEDKHNFPDTRVAFKEEPLLFAEHIPVETDLEKVTKVIRTILREFGEMDYRALCMTLTSTEEDTGTYVYRTIAHGLSTKAHVNHLLDALAVPEVLKVFQMAKTAERELHHFQGFVRFRELENKIMYAEISPKHNFMVYLMPHFADRFPQENFAIFDKNFKVLGIHPARREWFLTSQEEVSVNLKEMASSEEEKLYEELFRYFHERIAIKERKNLNLQRNMLPLRFRGDMTEFQ